MKVIREERSDGMTPEDGVGGMVAFTVADIVAGFTEGVGCLFLTLPPGLLYEIRLVL